MKKSTIYLPDAKDWGNIPKDDCDLQWSYNKLFGKNHEEVNALYAHYDCCALLDDIYWLDGMPFYYYMTGAMALIRAKSYEGFDAKLVASYFFMTLKIKHKQNESFITPIMDDIKLTVSFILENKQYFGINKTALSDAEYDQNLKEDMSYIKKMVSTYK